MDRRITRGSFLKAVGAAGVAGSTLSVLACQPNTTAQAGSGGGGPEEKELALYNFSDYVAENTIPSFERKTGIRVTQDFYSSSEQLLAKLQAGGSAYDVVVPSDYMVSIMIKSDVIQELNKSKIPNLDNLKKEFTDLPYDPDNNYSVPYQWGTAGICYDKGAVDERVTGWDLLWNEKYAGEMAMMTEMRATMGAALEYLGHSMNSTEGDELDAAAQALKEQKTLLRGYFDSNEIREMLIGGELVAGYMYSGDALQAMAKNDKLDYVLPAEGALIWTDAMAIPAAAPHPENAHKFLSHILEAKVHAAISNYTNYGCPNQAAMPYIDEALTSSPAVYPPPEVFERLTYVRDVGGATRQYERRWTEVLSA
jgi:spermidine/putrescine transport system substrate-binding protein